MEVLLVFVVLVVLDRMARHWVTWSFQGECHQRGWGGQADEVSLWESSRRQRTSELTCISWHCFVQQWHQFFGKTVSYRNWMKHFDTVYCNTFIAMHVCTRNMWGDKIHHLKSFSLFFPLMSIKMHCVKSRFGVENILFVGMHVHFSTWKIYMLGRWRGLIVEKSNHPISVPVTKGIRMLLFVDIAYLKTKPQALSFPLYLECLLLVFSCCCVCAWSLKGGWGCVMSPPCLESQGCHLIPLCYLLSCSSA